VYLYGQGTSAQVAVQGSTGYVGIGTTAPNNLLTVNGSIVPKTATTGSLGDATYYWNDVSAKSFTDRGCLGSFDKGAKMPDGRIVSDIESLKLIKVEPKRLTTYGVPKLDYSSMPVVVYKPAPLAEKDIYEEVDSKKVLKFKKGEKMGEDGAELTALISIMIGAIKELDGKIESQQVKIEQLSAENSKLKSKIASSKPKVVEN
jgi:hypothetical protein